MPRFFYHLRFMFHWCRSCNVKINHPVLNSIFRSMFQFAVVYLLQTKPWGTCWDIRDTAPKSIQCGIHPFYSSSMQCNTYTTEVFKRRFIPVAYLQSLHKFQNSVIQTYHSTILKEFLVYAPLWKALTQWKDRSRKAHVTRFLDKQNTRKPCNLHKYASQCFKTPLLNKLV